MTLGVIGDLLLELFDEDRSLRPRPDQTHLAANDVDQLWQFIDPQFANPPADASHARIALDGPNRAVRFGVYVHRAKLDDPKYGVMESDPLLQVEGGAARIEFDSQRSQQHQRRRQQSDDYRQRNVQQAARAPVEARPARGVGEDQLPETQPLAADLAGQPFVKGVGLIHRNAVAHFQFEKQIERQSPPPVRQRNDDSVGAISPDDRLKV